MPNRKVHNRFCQDQGNSPTICDWTSKKLGLPCGEPIVLRIMPKGSYSDDPQERTRVPAAANKFPSCEETNIYILELLDL